MTEHDTGLRRIVTAIAVVSVGVFVLFILGALYFGPKIVASNDATTEIQNGNRLGSCRAIYSFAVTAAQAQLTVDKADLDVAVSKALRAVADNDIAAVRAALEDNVPLEDKVVADGVDTSTQVSKAINAIQLAKDNPDAFLDQCQKDK